MFTLDRERALQAHMEQFARYVPRKVRLEVIYRVREFFKLSSDQEAVDKALFLPDEDIVVFVDAAVKKAL